MNAADIEVAPSNDQQKLIGERHNVRSTFFRSLFLLLSLQYIIATIEQWLSYQYPNTRVWVWKHWGVALGVKIQLALVVFVVYWARSFFKRAFINVVTYVYFVALLGYTLVYYSDGDSTICLTSSFAILAAFLAGYAMTTPYDLSFLGATIYIIGGAFLGYGFFLGGSDIAFYNLVLLTLGTTVLGFYLIYATRWVIVGQNLNNETEDPLVSSITVYADLIITFFRLIESVARLFKKNRF